MMICWNCKETFEHNETKWHTEPHGEVLGCCPHCGSPEIEEAAYCNICGKPMCDDDMTDGVCDDCMDELLTYDSFKAFALDGFKWDECSLLEDFLYSYVFGFCYSDVPGASHDELRKIFIRYYDETVADEKAMLRASAKAEPSFLNLIRDYVNREYKPEFADWLTKVNKDVEVIINA